MSKAESNNNVWVVILSVFAILISVSSAGISIVLYVKTPHDIATYMQTHKDEFKGDKGDEGRVGPQGAQGAAGATGRTGASASSSSYCNTQYYSTLNSASTTCF